MPETTEYLKLEKPFETENYSINVFNRNADKLDDELKEQNKSLLAKAAGNPATGDALNAEKVLGTDKIMTLDGTGSIGIPANTDLNDAQYRNWGKYRSGSDVNTRTLKNAPFTEAFGMIVYPGGHTNEYPVQEAFRIVDGLTRHRTWNTYTDSWFSGWREIAQTENTELTLLNGWESSGWVANKGVILSRSGNICALALYVKNPVTTGSESVIAMVPSDYRPKANREFIGYTLSQTMVRFSVHKSGEIYQYGALPANTIIALTDAYPIGG